MTKRVPDDELKQKRGNHRHPCPHCGQIVFVTRRTGSVQIVKPAIKECDQCGASYEIYSLLARNQRFCSKLCKTRFTESNRRARERSGKTNRGVFWAGSNPYKMKN